MMGNDVMCRFPVGSIICTSSHKLAFSIYPSGNGSSECDASVGGDNSNGNI